MGVHQWVFGVERRGPMWLLVLGAVRGCTGETRAGGRLFDPGANITPHHPLSRCSHKGVGGDTLRRHLGPGCWHRKPRSTVTSLFVFLGNQSKNFIDAELRTFVELVFAERTGTDGARCPVTSDTRLPTQDKNTLNLCCSATAVLCSDLRWWPPWTLPFYLNHRLLQIKGF